MSGDALKSLHLFYLFLFAQKHSKLIQVSSLQSANTLIFVVDFRVKILQVSLFCGAVMKIYSKLVITLSLLAIIIGLASGCQSVQHANLSSKDPGSGDPLLVSQKAGTSPFVNAASGENK